MFKSCTIYWCIFIVFLLYNNKQYQQEVNIYNEAKIKAKHTTKKIVIVLVLLLAIIIVCAFVPLILSLTVREYRTIKDIPAPVQASMHRNVASMAGSNWSAKITFLAEYEIRGLVVGTDDYSGDSLYDRISPRDISIAWGDMAANNNLISWQRGEREITAEISSLAKMIIGKDYDELFTQYSNNHIIPKDSSILDKVKAIKRGDYVLLKGYLVDVKVYDKNEPSIFYQLTSSLVRDDNGDSSCEVLYVTDVDYLD